MNPSIPENLDDFPAIVGSSYTGDWLKLSPERIQGFWIGTYLDKAYGDSLGPEYPPGLVEGFHQLALLDHMSTEILGRWHGYNYGLDRVRFLSPLTDDKAVRLVLTVADVNPKPKGLLVTYDVVLEAEGQTKPTMAARWLVLLQDLQPVYSES